MIDLAISPSSPAFLLASPDTLLTLTTVSFTPEAGSTIVCQGVANSNVPHDFNLPTATGQTDPFLPAPGNIRVQEAPAGSWVLANAQPVATTVTLTRTNTAGTSHGFALQVIVVPAAEPIWGGSVFSANANSGLPSGAITATRRGSLLLAVSSDWSAGGNATVVNPQINTMLNQTHIAGEYSGHFWRRNLTVPSGIHTLALATPAAQDYNLAIVEIRPIVVRLAARSRRLR